MRKTITLLVTILAIGCGSQPGAPAAPDSQNPARPGVGSVPLFALLPTTTVAKIVLKTTQPVDQPVTTYDGATDSFVTIACGTPECAAVSGSFCKDSVCTTTSNVSFVSYIQNIDPRVATSFNVPCDGNTYTAEVYGAVAGVTNTYAESHVSAPFSVPVSCTPVPTVSWLGAVAPAPTLAFPTIYAGLGAPKDRYTVQVNGLGYPWASTGWSLTYAGQDTTAHPTKYSGASATLDSPATNATLNFTAAFHLNRSLLLVNEGSWDLTVGSSQTPVGSVGVPLP